MAISSFDTHKFVRRMEAAGLTLEQAEAHAEVLNEAFTVNLENLVTKDYFESRLDSRFVEQKSYLDTRFADQNAYIDKRFAEQTAYIDTRFAEQNAYIDKRFAEQETLFDTRFNKLESNQRVLMWTQAIIVSAVLLPYFERMMAL